VNRVKRTALVALIVLASLGVAAWADLPPPEPPTPPAARPKGLLMRRSADDAPSDNESGNYQPPRVEQDDLEADLLMKRIGDPRLPMPDDWEQQVTSVSRAAHVGTDRMAQRVEELLLMLENVTPLRDGADASRWQVRHRAAVTLSVISHVWFGHLPTCAPGEALTAEQRENARRILDQWRQWWKEAAPMDEVQRRDLAHRLRMPLLESGDLDLAWPNLIHAYTDRDMEALPVMGKVLLEADPMTSRAQRLVSFYGNLCRSGDAPRDAALRLVEFLRKNNQPNAIHRSAAVQQAAFYAQQISGVSMEYQKQVDAPADEADAGGGNVYIIDPQALDAWEKAIKAKADAPAADGEANEEDGDF